MLALSSRSFRRVTGSAPAALGLSLAILGLGTAAGAQQPTPPQPSAAGGQATVQKSSEAATAQRIPRQQASTTTAIDGVLREIYLHERSSARGGSTTYASSLAKRTGCARHFLRGRRVSASFFFRPATMNFASKLRVALPS